MLWAGIIGKLGIVALLIGWESLMRLTDPVAIDFGQATVVAVVVTVVAKCRHIRGGASLA